MAARWDGYGIQHGIPEIDPPEDASYASEIDALDGSGTRHTPGWPPLITTPSLDPVDPESCSARKRRRLAGKQPPLRAAPVQEPHKHNEADGDADASHAGAAPASVDDVTQEPEEPEKPCKHHEADGDADASDAGAAPAGLWDAETYEVKKQK